MSADGLNVQHKISMGYGVAVFYLHVLHVQHRIGKGYGVALSTDVLNGRGREGLFVLTIFVLLRSEHWCGQPCKHSELTV